MKQSRDSVLLSVGAHQAFLPLVTSFVEQAAMCFGLGKEEALKLTLAAEEVFMHVCRVMTTDGPFEIRCSNGGYYTEAVFSLPRAHSLDMRAFNLTATVTMADDTSLEQMGLLIASRSVDRFSFTRNQEGALELALIKEKSYPSLPETALVVARPLEKWSLRAPDPEEAKHISQLARSYYDTWALSNILLHPGKLADRIKAGEYRSLAAVGRAGEIAGAIFWHWVGESTLECVGPYIFNQTQSSAMAEELIEGCLGAVAKTRAVGIMNRRPTAEFPRQHFERLGTFDVCGQDGSRQPVEAWFRLLQEDAGCAVWVHPQLEDFVRRECTRLVLPREIRIDQASGETLPKHSVLSAEFDRLRASVTLRAMWPGADAGENIERHVGLLREEEIRCIYFALDLGEAWQTVFVPGLLETGFEPRLVLPYAGQQGDVVMFQLRGKEA